MMKFFLAVVAFLLVCSAGIHHAAFLNAGTGHWWDVFMAFAAIWIATDLAADVEREWRSL